MLPEEKRIKTKGDLKRFLKTELSKYGSRQEILFLPPIREKDVLAKHNVLLRKTEYHMNTHHLLRGILYKARLQHFQNKYAIHIPINTCEEGLKIMHVGPILLNGNVSVGKNCSLHINTGIVAGGLNSEAPTLGDGVVVGMGAVLLGGIFIADNVAVGANAVVTKSVLEENVAVAGVPAKVVSNHGRLEWNKK